VRRAARRAILVVAALLPGPLKRALLRACFGYRIGRGVRIGLAYLDCRELSLEDGATVAHGVAFVRCGRVRVGRQAFVGPLNLLRGGERIELGDYAQLLRLNVVNAIPDHDCVGQPDSSFLLGHGAVITSGHRIDFTDRVSIGRCSMLAGRGSTLWTHNRRRSKPVSIGDYCYVGSEVRMAPGAAIPDCCLVGIGAVVTAALADGGTLIAGSPARPQRRLGPDDAETLFGKTRPDLPDEPYPTLPLARAASPRPPAAAAAASSGEGTSLEARVRQVVADVARVDPASVALDRWLPEHGIDSLQLLVVRETLEGTFGVYLPDHVWLGFRSLQELVDHLAAQPSSPRGGPAAPASPATAFPSRAGVADGTPRIGGASTASSAVVDSSAAVRRKGPPPVRYDVVDVGMPLTGRNNLAEGPLLQLLGHLRWRHISSDVGVPSRLIADADGERLYATFFYVELAFPAERPMAVYGENDRIKLASGVRRFGLSMMDGVSYLLPADHPEADAEPFASVDDALAHGVPAARLSNIFVRQFGGAEWLKKSRPANPELVGIPEVAEAPDSYLLVKQAQQDGCFARPSNGYVPITQGPVRAQYELVPDRDLNGAGLVYFANYPVFLDICEREVLASASLPIPEPLLDRRTLTRRRSAYLSNASSQDALIVELEAWVANPFSAGVADAATAPIRLFVNFRMLRRSDGRLMMVSTAEKTIMGTEAGALPFFESLARSATPPRSAR
jgi:probable biosynthetic protein (TIGR04098 family)